MDNNDCILLVEGPNDKHVVRHLRNRHQEIPEFCIRDKGGIEGLLEDIGLEILAPSRKAIGILVDANDDLDARWNAVANRLREENIEVPSSPELTGTIIDSNPSRRHLVDAQQYITRRTRKLRLRDDPRRRSSMAAVRGLH